MRLLNAATRCLEEFVGDDIPRYAILSHTWGPNELTFDNLVRSEPVPSNAKIDGCCRRVLSRNLGYVWIDTICINKNSSAELSEAINSMFEWYRASAVCYAYLSDVSSLPDLDGKPPGYAYFVNKKSEFCRSRWFTRGWTLQELLAPETVQFYDADWKYISKNSWFYAAVAQITGVPRLVLQGETRLEDVCIAARMAWAANRRTTRKEDIAYCLMGIFGVNMAMLYGEGDRAFTRLQEEIIRKSDDESIFAWGFGSTGETSSASTQFLASSPADFEGCEGIWKGVDKPEPEGSVTNRSYWERELTPHYSLTNKGLLIKRRLLALLNFENSRGPPETCARVGTRSATLGTAWRNPSLPDTPEVPVYGQRVPG
ncbi:heterokaryon incompatibility protein-domain-containing protein [Cladorrhinum samala]|uniref:Heterokaryon incompatibility protein-domain-containing protein n=1 Tax=Cladorrhinum samala TaxID=585594 RepID=A0AAV9HVL6_9PEZI|nr:heterokaryon incompatibility protein-domain-containing protein [Cladorrhinum samala]